MKKIKWSDKYKTGISDIDEQHEKIFSIINRLYDHIKNGIQERPDEILKDLDDYISIHFSTEMKFFVIYNYPEAAKHNDKHSQFSDKLRTYTSNMEITSKELHNLYYLLESWFETHILTIDMAFRDYMKFNSDYVF